MMLIEQTQVPDTALPVAEFRDHLQLGSGFADDGLQDAVLVAQLKAAISAIETDTAKVLIRRDFKYVVTAWRGPVQQVLPVAPVETIQSVTITDLGGGEEVFGPEDFTLVRDADSPALRWLGWALPIIPVGGTAEIDFTAGFAASWTGVPADLSQAVLMLAAHFYENRSGAVDRTAAFPPAVAGICRRHKPIRLLGGGRA